MDHCATVARCTLYNHQRGREQCTGSASVYIIVICMQCTISSKIEMPFSGSGSVLNV